MIYGNNQVPCKLDLLQFNKMRGLFVTIISMYLFLSFSQSSFAQKSKMKIVDKHIELADGSQKNYLGWSNSGIMVKNNADGVVFYSIDES